MRLIEHEGKQAKITEEDWRKLLARFNPENEGPRDVLCALCWKFEPCSECPLGIFGSIGKRELGCKVLIEHLLNQRVCLYTAYIAPDHVGGVENMKKIHDALLALPKVSRY